MRPVDLIGLSDNHVLAVLPLVLGGELGVSLVVVMAFKTFAFLRHIVHRSLAVFVVFTDTQVLGSQMPMDIDRAKTGLEVRAGDGDTATGIEFSLVAKGDVGTGLLQCLDNTIHHALMVLESFNGLGTIARVCSSRRAAGRSSFGGGCSRLSGGHRRGGLGVFGITVKNTESNGGTGKGDGGRTKDVGELGGSRLGFHGLVLEGTLRRGFDLVGSGGHDGNGNLNLRRRG